MGHGFFVPLVVGFIVWQKRAELLALQPAPNWWGLAVVLYAGLQLWIATLGAELFLARTAFVISVIGIVLLLGGTAWVRALAFPLFLLFFMIPIPTVIYNKITFPLQLFASWLAEGTLDLLGYPVYRGQGDVDRFLNDDMLTSLKCLDRDVGMEPAWDANDNDINI